MKTPTEQTAHEKRVKNRAFKYRITRAQAEREIAELDAKRAAKQNSGK